MSISIENNSLTQREIEVLTFVIKGQTNKVIAINLNVCEKTIEFHLQNIYDKLNIKNKIEAAVWAAQNIKTRVIPSCE